MKYAIVEKANHLAVHGYFDSLDRAEGHLAEVVPIYVERSYFTNRALQPSDFEIIEMCARTSPPSHQA